MDYLCHGKILDTDFLWGLKKDKLYILLDPEIFDNPEASEVRYNHNKVRVIWVKTNFISYLSTGLPVPLFVRFLNKNLSQLTSSIPPEYVWFWQILARLDPLKIESLNHRFDHEELSLWMRYQKETQEFKFSEDGKNFLTFYPFKAYFFGDAPTIDHYDAKRLIYDGLEQYFGFSKPWRARRKRLSTGISSGIWYGTEGHVYRVGSGRMGCGYDRGREGAYGEWSTESHFYENNFGEFTGVLKDYFTAEIHEEVTQKVMNSMEKEINRLPGTISITPEN